MKAFIVVFLAVAVSGEADPYTLGQVAHGQTAGGVITGVDYGHGLVSGVGALGTGRVATHPLYPAVTYATHGVGYPYTNVYGGAHYIGKREAEAEPYTIGQIVHGAHIANAAADGRLHNVGVITNAAVTPVHATYATHAGVYPYAGFTGYTGYPYTGVYGNAHYIGKREAEAEPWTVAQVAHGAHITKAAVEGRLPGVITNAAITPVTHTAAHVPVPITHAAPVVTAPVTYATHAGVYPYAGFTGYTGYPYTNVYGNAHLLGKREAEPFTTYVHPGFTGVHAGVYAGVHAVPAVVPATAVHAPTAFGHGVAHTPFGTTHSSNVGVCTNYLGHQVSC